MTTLASSVATYLGCVGLVVGGVGLSVGLTAKYMVGERATTPEPVSAQPETARDLPTGGKALHSQSSPQINNFPLKKTNPPPPEDSVTRTEKQQVQISPQREPHHAGVEPLTTRDVTTGSKAPHYQRNPQVNNFGNFQVKRTNRPPPPKGSVTRTEKRQGHISPQPEQYHAGVDPVTARDVPKASKGPHSQRHGKKTKRPPPMEGSVTATEKRFEQKVGREKRRRQDRPPEAPQKTIVDATGRVDREALEARAQFRTNRHPEPSRDGAGFNPFGLLGMFAR